MPFSEIDILPDPPQRDGDPDTFADLADIFVVAMQTMTEQLNVFKTELETAAALINAAPAYADPGLVALAGLTPAANKLAYYTGASTSALTDLTSVARTLLAQASQANMRTTGLGMSASGSSLVSAADYAAMKALLDLEAGTDFLSPAAISAAYQPLDSDLTAIAALATTSFGRSLLTQADAAAVRSTISAITGSSAISGSASSGKVQLGPITLTWRDHSFSGTTTYAYGDGHTYSTFARAWIEGDDGSEDVSGNVTVHGTSNATVRAASAFSGVLFSIGV